MDGHQGPQGFYRIPPIGRLTVTYTWQLMHNVLSVQQCLVMTAVVLNAEDCLRTCGLFEDLRMGPGCTCVTNARLLHTEVGH
jgi:hypothetical protein